VIVNVIMDANLHLNWFGGGWHQMRISRHWWQWQRVQRGQEDEVLVSTGKGISMYQKRFGIWRSSFIEGSFW